MDDAHCVSRVLRSLAAVSIVMGCSLASQRAYAATLCGTYAPVPGSTVTYEYIPGGANPVVLPLAGQLTFDCGVPTTMLVARLDNPIIGVDEQGNVIFPIGGQFPMTVSGQSADSRRFTGSLLETPYLFDWEFDPNLSGNLIWNGFVAWSGGRYEYTSITDIVLTPVPEPSAAMFFLVVILARGKSAQKLLGCSLADRPRK